MPGADDWSQEAAEGAVKVLVKIVLPSAAVGAVAGCAFSPASLALREILAPTTQQVLQADMTQYMQNAFAVVGLIFVLLLGNTLSFLFSRQESLFLAVYNEVSETQVLMEQLSLLAQDRQAYAPDLSEGILRDLEKYIEEDLMRIGEPKIVDKKMSGEVDVLERLVFATSVGIPSDIAGCVRNIRQARAQRLYTVQRQFPLAHYGLLLFYALLTLAVFLILGAGLAGFEPAGQAGLYGHSVAMLAPYFGLLVAAIVLTFFACLELRDRADGLFGVRSVLEKVVDGLLTELRNRRSVAARALSYQQ